MQKGGAGVKVKAGGAKKSKVKAHGCPYKQNAGGIRRLADEVGENN